MDAQDGALHVVVFPWLAFGHMIPFLELSKSLARRGHRVSFISTPINLSRLPALPSDLTSHIDLVSFPLPAVDNLPAGAESTNDLRPDQVEFLKKAFDGLESCFSQFLRAASPRKPDWVVVDFAQHWVPAIASEFKIKYACLLIFPPPFMAFLWGDVDAAAEENGEWRKTVEDFTKQPKWIPSPFHNIAYRPHEAEAIVWICRDNASGISDLKRFVPIARGCSFFAIRGCYEFDASWLTLNAELYGKPFIPVGLLPPSGVREEDKARDGEPEILEWLSKRPSRSVVYVAFGSEDTLSPEQKRELALGLELSKIPFLWALRRPAGHPVAELLPEAFLERTKDYGLVATGWVPQLKVLGHESIGAFYTHCGWSSIIEGLQFGHPFIIMPLFGDQGILARRLEGEKIGVEVPWNEEERSFTKEAVAAAVRKVMADDEGKGMRGNAQKLQQVFAEKDIHESYIDKFIQQLKVHKD